MKNPYTKEESSLVEAGKMMQWVDDANFGIKREPCSLTLGAAKSLQFDWEKDWSMQTFQVHNAYRYVKSKPELKDQLKNVDNSLRPILLSHRGAVMKQKLPLSNFTFIRETLVNTQEDGKIIARLYWCNNCAVLYIILGVNQEGNRFLDYFYYVN